ncbi:Sulfite reductase [NADPH] flavoprotein alpha-component [Pseudobythopirellula maris]|uniref:assimilatory sulfite reductase (NADPH) n=1 Tax=Pseudobythopirellula maris TaxID=2527991 RepID=A0A5C5ZRU2_9BACT|nr:sulfite reductase subunit alpha [Pseudobythopirellula maris]TWT89768.1 Sulfite reductase [NADPH] flavoprotein alpha-component [Pseudobythopirellula maris]
MSVSIIPETAPFNDEQRAWLNGFLAGWIGVESNGADAATALLEAPAEEEEEDFPWHDPGLAMDERLELAAEKPIERKMMAAMAQLDCGACGYLCQTYSEAIARGEEKSLTLCSPGGKETSKMLKKLVKEGGGAPSSNGATATAKPATAAGFTRSNPYPAKLKASYNLNGEGSSKHTAHVEIDLEGSGLDYRVGDALGVYPTNCPELVDMVLGATSLDGGAAVSTDNGEKKLREALVTDFNLCDVEEELVELLIKLSPNADERVKLRELIDDDAIDDLDVLDVLALAPGAKVTADGFLETLAAMQPRLYSIASSIKKHPGEVHLTVGRVGYELGGRARKGVASTMFADRLGVGETVRVFLHESADFTTPADPKAPMIMVGPGTGIAPFRAFLEERQATAAPGKNWLFFGDQHAASDFLYRDELERLVDAGLLARLDTAFSRDQAEKVYVQDRMREHGEELYAWLKQGGYFFVCGDAKRMAADVDRALHDVVAQHGGMTEERAKAFVDDLRAKHRYVRDVY